MEHVNGIKAAVVGVVGCLTALWGWYGWLVTAWVACMALPFFSLSTAITKRKPLFTRYSLYTLKSNSNFSHEKAAKELGFKRRPLRETIADALAWVRKEGKV